MLNWRKPLIVLGTGITGSRLLNNLNLIEQVSRLKREDLMAQQNKKLEDLLLYCNQNVPYYKKLFKDTGLITGGQINLQRFKDLPVLTKDLIRKNHDTLISSDACKRGCFFETSGGSTGEPIQLIQDQFYSEWNIANKLYYKTFAGQDIGHKELRLWGSERDILEGKENLSIRLRNFLYNRLDLNAFKMSSEDMHNFILKWNKYKPLWVESYVHSIYEFAKYISDNNFSIHSPNGILTSAGTLHKEMKTYIEGVYNCRVYNRYGSREVGDIACSCGESDALHISMWNNYVETLDESLNPAGDGNIGKIFITTLNNYSMPLLRYDIGDIGILNSMKTCVCGRETLLFESVKGREVSLFKTKDNKLIDGEYFTHLFYFKDWLKNFQIVQKDYDIITCNIVLNDTFTGTFSQDISIIEKSIRIVMGQNCEIIWNYVSRIEPLKSGKYVYTISML